MINTNIDIYKQDLEVLRSTAEQIKKDFREFNIELYIAEDPNTAFEQLRERLGEIVAILMQSHSNMLMSLLYRIDIPEEKLKLALESADRPVEIELADLIIKRELLKVLYRKFWSSK